VVAGLMQHSVVIWGAVTMDHENPPEALLAQLRRQVHEYRAECGRSDGVGAGKHVFPGTYAVRTTTLRAVFMDLAAELGEQGFRWIFVIHGHGAPNHNRVLHQAGDYFRDVYGGHMVHLSDVIPDVTSMPGGPT